MLHDSQKIIFSKILFYFFQYGTGRILKNFHFWGSYKFPLDLKLHLILVLYALVYIQWFWPILSFFLLLQNTSSAQQEVFYDTISFDDIFFFLLFLGDLKNEGSVLEWLLSSDNRELDDAIEAVNEKMLSKLLQTTPFMAVFFCKFSFWLYTKKKIKYFAHLTQQLILKIVFDQLGKVI